MRPEFQHCGRFSSATDAGGRGVDQRSCRSDAVERSQPTGRCFHLNADPTIGREWIRSGASWTDYLGSCGGRREGRPGQRHVAFVVRAYRPDAGRRQASTRSHTVVLLTHGRATEVHPEAVLTFRTQDPITISTDRSSQAFAPVRQEDYEPAPQAQRPQLARRRPGFGAPYPCGYPPVYGSVGVVIVSGGGRH